MNLINLTKIMLTLSLLTKITILISLAWLSVEAIIFIGENGLKELVSVIWNGAKQ